MNYLAHLHLASLADSSLPGNLLADYVRGNPAEQWSPAIAEGIALHRRIDALTDSLPEVSAARRLFRPQTRRVSGITLDVVWDHFLALHWDRLMPQQTLSAFVTEAERVITPDLTATPAGFQRLNQYLWRERWMERYAEASFLQRVLAGMASRRPKLAALAESYQDFVTHYQQLETLFWQFYPQMMNKASRQIL